MIVKGQLEDTGYVPITLYFKLETPEEMEKFYSLFNHAAITNGLGIEASAEAVRAKIIELNGGEVPTKDHWFKKLCAHIDDHGKAY